MDAVPRPGRVAEAALLAGVGIVLAWAVLDGHGSRDGALATAGIVAIACAAAGIALGLRGTVPLPRLDRAGVVTVVAAVALTLWAGLSIWWSIAGDLSWNWLARGLVYLAFLALGALAGAPAGGARRVATLVALVVGAAIGWALLGVAIPSLFPDGDRIARLREPVGYWNALALLADAALALGLWVARGPRVAGRAAGLLLVYGAALVVLLTQSRAGVVGALAVLALWLVLSDERLEDAVRAVVAAVPALLVGGWAFTRPALVEDGALRADRVADGKVFAALTIGGAVLVALAAWRVSATRLVERRGGPAAKHARRPLRARGRRRFRRACRQGRQPLLLGELSALARRVRQRPGAAHRPLRQQPAAMVGRGARRRRRSAGRRLRRRDVRARPPALPRERDARHRAAQRPAPAARRPRGRGSRPRPHHGRRRDRGRSRRDAARLRR